MKTKKEGEEQEKGDKREEGKKRLACLLIFISSTLARKKKRLSRARVLYHCHVINPDIYNVQDTMI